MLALAPAASEGRPGDVPALAELGGTCLVGRLLATLSEVGLPAPLVMTTEAAVPRMRRALGRGAEVRASQGGRAQAIIAALAELDGTSVLILDAERALTPASVISEVLAAAGDDVDAVVPVIPMTDSVKLVTHDGLRNVDRSTLAGLQSPRLLRRTVLENAVRLAVDDDQDEILAVLARGARVRTVPGSHAGFAVVDRLGLWQAQIALGLARDTSHRHGLSRRG
ncbi:2-C-methyl-D-erythritol 4-phosphate cytidylyltransferase [Brachybacterium sp. Marseille-Q2903]|uniref:2-C-methyl-D-erythritol 4-phosphate cytidylyltransferase n=1 Tax=Brachybacterium epidermidis TaxID=2781983 RepID=A0ABR9VZW0_9MICO|nr:2-C-methyl-D-erythritol 4-phosphate cytidylyltransferase [Brachybacterium epidermidis]